MTATTDERTDNELMLAVRGGDLYALGVLFQRHRDKAYGLCLRLTGDAHLADDIVQETYLRILRYRHTFAGESRFTTWMYRIARNATMDALQRDSRGATAMDEIKRDAEADGTSGTSEDVRLAYLAEALARLPMEKREVLVLSRYHDLRYEEIAAVCDCAVGTVKARVHRAMRELRLEYEQLERKDDEMRAGRRQDHRRTHG